VNRDLILLSQEWDASSSSLSKRSFQSKRVAISRNRSRTTTTISNFYISVDGNLTFLAHNTLHRDQKPCAWIYMKVSETRWAAFYLYQVADTDIKLERVAYALSTWYHDSRQTTGPRPVVAYFSTTLEIRKHQNWDTLYAKHPLVRSCSNVLTFSRSKKTNIDWNASGTLNFLEQLYRKVASLPDNKVQFAPIV